jgi:hypothetical protein
MKYNLYPAMIFLICPLQISTCQPYIYVCHAHLTTVQNFNVFHISLDLPLLPFPGPLDCLFPLHRFSTIGHMCDLEWPANSSPLVPLGTP